MTKAHPVEKDVKRKGKELLAKHGWFHWMPPANQFGKSGISDLHAVKPGVFMVVEFKLDAKHHPTELQKAFLVMIHEAGHLAFVVNGDNIQHFEKFLQLFDEAQATLQKGGEEKDITGGGDMVDCIFALTKPFAEFETRMKMAAASRATAH